MFYENTRILVVEDDLQVASFIHRSLQEIDYDVQVAYDGETGLALARNFQPQLVIADVVMPVKNGLQLCRQLRAEGYASPILLLTALVSTPDIVAGLDAGADDYLSKPFQLPELMARIRALLRRQEARLQQQFLQVDDLHINLQSKEVQRAGKTIQLTAKEFQLLEYLVRNKGHLKTRAEILEEVWNLSFDPGTNVVDVYINFLRNKIDKPFERRLLFTRPGLGYILQHPQNTNEA
jgi:DNA-binding response OmpR family regulator